MNQSAACRSQHRHSSSAARKQYSSISGLTAHINFHTRIINQLLSAQALFCVHIKPASNSSSACNDGEDAYFHAASTREYRRKRRNEVQQMDPDGSRRSIQRPNPADRSRRAIESAWIRGRGAFCLQRQWNRWDGIPKTRRRKAQKVYTRILIAAFRVWNCDEPCVGVAQSNAKQCSCFNAAVVQRQPVQLFQRMFEHLLFFVQLRLKSPVLPDGLARAPDE